MPFPLPRHLSHYRETFGIAVQSLALHKMRTFLTMLGIVFGVGAVIAMLSIGEGARQESLEQIEVMGVRNVIIRSLPAEEETGASTGKPLRPLGISRKDAAAIRSICPFVEDIAESWEASIDARTYEGSVKATLIGTTPEYESIFNLTLSEGSFLVPHHLRTMSNVCIIGAEVRKALFGFRNPLHQLIKLQDQWFTVIGVVEARELAVKSEEAELQSAQSKIFIPLSTAMAKYPRSSESGGTAVFFGGGRRRFRSNDDTYLDRNTLDQITVRVRSDADILESSKVIAALVTQRHNGQKDFTVTIPEELIEQSQKTQRIFNIVMGAIAGISLLVGGIGIMNIMLASVLERTREIGIRRAIGATRSMVIVQFLTEATLISVIGGVMGVGLGWGLTMIITLYAGWRTIVNVWSILLAFSVAVATGILFGYYPARQAALKDVIESLRYE